MSCDDIISVIHLNAVCVLLMFRYPVVLEQFSLRPGSGGAGKYCGGDGVIRKLLFRNKVVLSVLTERRSTRPYGLRGKFSISKPDDSPNVLNNLKKKSKCSHFPYLILKKI